MLSFTRLEKKEETENNCWLIGKYRKQLIIIGYNKLLHFRNYLLHCCNVFGFTNGNYFNVCVLYKCKYPPELQATNVTSLYNLQRDGGCGLNYFFISFHLVMSIVISVVAILPPIQNGKVSTSSFTWVYNLWYIAQPRSGLLQAAVVTLYTTFLLYSAVSNEPYGSDTSNFNVCDYKLVNGICTDCDLSHNNDGNVFSQDGNEIAAGVLGIVLIFATTTYLTWVLCNR